MRVIGVDPGSIRTGFGVVEGDRHSFQLLGSGVLRSNVKKPISERLYAMLVALRELIQLYRPQVLCLERTYLGANVQTAIRLGEARGIALVAAAEAKLALFEYMPSEVKLAVTSNGRADKKDVALMVRRILNLGDDFDLETDAADALALALCHLYHARNFKSDSKMARQMN